MPIEYRCSGCRKLLRAPDASAGQQAACPHCGTLSVVPGVPGSQGSAVLPVDPPPPLSPAPLGPALSPSALPAPPPFPTETSAVHQVNGPALGLVLTGALGLVLNGLAMLLWLLGALPVGGAGAANELPWELAAAVAAYLFLSVLLSALVCWGGLSMKSRQNYKLAVAAAILALLPCTSPTCLTFVLGVPIGIWSLIVLGNYDVKRAFAANQAASRLA